MKTNLFIVESSTKCKTISKYLSSPEIKSAHGSFIVMASNGHIRDLVQKKEGTTYGIDIRDWKANYQIMKNSANTIENLKQNVRKADMIWLATDLDREGEAIAWHLKEVLKPKRYKRITFNEITERSIRESLLHPRDLDYNLIDAQQGRRILDRVIGFSLTKALWNKINSYTSLSAGRVQSVLLHLICENVKKIESFETSPYWTLHADIKVGNIQVKDACLYEKNMVKFVDQFILLKFMKKLSSCSLRLNVKETSIKSIKENPPPPHTTSTLQQDAYNKIGFSSKKTMMIAQDLYEKGHITYMRTDSTVMSSSAMSKLKSFLETKNLGMYFKSRVYLKKSKNSQEAHECIRPTKFKQIEGLTKDQASLYQLIFTRAVCSQMIEATFDELAVIFDHSIDSETRFIGKYKILKEPGFMIFSGKKQEDDVDLREFLKDLRKSDSKIKFTNAIAKNTYTIPPNHFTESRLVKIMEGSGVGRPSTYSSIIEKLFDRHYIEKRNIEGVIQNYCDFILNFKNNTLHKKCESRSSYNEKNAILPTPNGLAVNGFLKSAFPEIIDVEFTNLMESDLDSISSGEKALKNVLTKFVCPFLKKISTFNGKTTKIEVSNTRRIIKIKDEGYIVRNARYGPVIEFNGKFISLAQYMSVVNKTIDEIDKNDVSFLISLPKIIDNEEELHYGRYGFYIKKPDGKTRRLYKKDVMRYIK